ncbi:MAG: CoA-binding protein [Promethearchaeia archaeon]
MVQGSEKYSIMDMPHYLEDYETMKTLFIPENVAFVGASESAKMGTSYYMKAFKVSKWKDNFYPVNPNQDKVYDWKCYPSVLSIPDPIDQVYIGVKAPLVPSIVKECVQKGVKWVIIFTSGFSELGTHEGQELTEKIIEHIEGTETRVVGPNCLGPFYAKYGMNLDYAREDSIANPPGRVSFMSQSGGHLANLVDAGGKMDIDFCYGISFGNQLDINCVDILNFYRQDNETEIIAAYLESLGRKNQGKGYRFVELLRETTLEKPVILWKGGFTEAGAQAANSHTGAISTSSQIWETAAKQTGSILVRDNIEFWNMIKTLDIIFPDKLPKGRNVGIITPGGGISVNSTDTFEFHGLNVPQLTEKTQKKLSEILPGVNTNIKNPIDLGFSGFFIEIFINVLRELVKDDNINIIVLPLWPEHYYRFMVKKFIEVEKESDKPFLYVFPNASDSLENAKKFNKIRQLMHKKDSLYLYSIQHAARVLKLTCDYADYLTERGGISYT